MKKLNLVLIMLLVAFSTTLRAEKPIPTITVKITFGRGSDCTNKGICNISVGAGAAIIIQNTPNNHLTFTFPDNVVKANGKYFEQNVFVMDESYTIPRDIQTKLESKQPIVLEKGTYRVEKSAKGFVVNFSSPGPVPTVPSEAPARTNKPILEKKK